MILRWLEQTQGWFSRAPQFIRQKHLVLDLVESHLRQGVRDFQSSRAYRRLRLSRTSVPPSGKRCPIWKQGFAYQVLSGRQMKVVKWHRWVQFCSFMTFRLTLLKINIIRVLQLCPAKEETKNSLSKVLNQINDEFQERYPDAQSLNWSADNKFYVFLRLICPIGQMWWSMPMKHSPSTTASRLSIKPGLSLTSSNTSGYRSSSTRPRRKNAR